MKTKHFHFLGRAVIEHDGWFLLARAKGASNTFLPGGHVEIGESVPDAIRREIMEECGFSAAIHRYIGAVEHRWSDGDQDNCEVNHLFHVSLPQLKSHGDIVSSESHLELFWAPASRLAELNLKPAPLIRILPRCLGESEAVWASTLKDAETEPGATDNPDGAQRLREDH